jgi:hypothetical protein
VIAPPLVLVALAAAAAQTATTTTSTTAATESSWTLREQLQIPAMTANHVVGGLGFGVGFEKGPLALEAEGQVLPVVICDSSCGAAYAAGLGLSVMPGSGREVTPRFALMVEYFAHPGLHQSFPAISPRAGVRWLSGSTGVSLDAVLSFAAHGNFETGGFAHNKVLSWAMPGLVMGIWF